MDAYSPTYKEHSTNPDTAGQQTIATFLEFARQPSCGGIPRLRSENCQRSPIVTRHLTREGLFTSSSSSSQPQPSEVVEPPSPLLSPSAISPDCGEAECIQDVFIEASARPRSYSTPNPPLLPNPAEFQQALNSVREMSGLGIQSPESPEVIVARKLRAIADDYDRHCFQPRCSVWSTIAAALGCPHREIIDEFVRCIKRLKYEDFSWEFVVRFFMIGLRLLESLSSRNIYQEQQSELLGIFLDFLTEKLTTWIRAQGGWESFLAEVRASQQLRSASSPDIFLSPQFPHQLERIPSEHAGETDSSTTHMLRSPPCSQQPLLCHLPKPVVRMASAQERSRAVSVPARPTSLCLQQNASSHSFPSENSSFLSHDASAQTSSGSSTRNQLLSAGLAFAFGIALGSFLSNLK